MNNKKPISIHDVCREMTDEEIKFEKWKFEYMDKLGIELYFDERHKNRKN